MFVPVCDRPSVAELTGRSDAMLWRQGVRSSNVPRNGERNGGD
jgi:hypothetical protein